MKAPVARRHRGSVAMGFALVTLSMAVAFASGRARTAIALTAPPSPALSRFAHDTLEAIVRGEAAPVPSADARAYVGGPIVIIVWSANREVTRVVTRGSWASAMQRAGRTLRADENVRARAEQGAVRFSIEVGVGEGPLAASPFEPFTVVPLVEGLHAHVGERDAYLTPLEMLASDAYAGAIQTSSPDYAVGVDLDALRATLASKLGLSARELVARGEVTRIRFARVSRTPYPSEPKLDRATLLRAVNDAGDFLIRFQDIEGRYTYLYDPRTGAPKNTGWSLARHAGTAYFMAQLARRTGRADARASAIAAIGFLKARALHPCGAPTRLCVTVLPRVEIGSSALLAIACAEILRAGPDEEIERLLRGLTAFLRSQQRADGELMHRYDILTNRAIDVQLPYFSGEAALAFVMAYDVLHDARDIAVARRLLRGIVATWHFPFDAYYYGEEHWTCIAASEARASIHDETLTAFCRGWLEHADRLQYRAGETPWPIEGAYGVGPVLVPNITPIASRTEAFVSTYALLRERGEDTTLVRAHIERSLRALLRYRLAPGPIEIMNDPDAARGGMPASPLNLSVRNDYVQHAGSAWLRYLDLLENERTHTRNSTDTVPTE